MPASFAPHASRDSRSSAPRQSAPHRDARANQSQAHTSRPSSPRPERRGVTPAVAPVPARPRKARTRSVGKTVLRVFVALLLIIGCIFAGLYAWVNSNLRKEAWLTDKSNNSKATTWLILGSDERDGSTGHDGTTGARTDTMLVLTKPQHGPSSLISIPRDSLVEIDGYYMKINAVMGEVGREQVVNEVEDIIGYKVDHVAELSFGGLQNVVNAMGGVNLCYDSDVHDEKSGMDWIAGCHTVDGAQALAFSRMRYSDPKGDFGRAERQRQVIGAIAKKAMSPSILLNPGKLGAIGKAALGSLTVDKKTTPFTLMSMLLAFHDASGSDGITGSVYWSNPDYYVDGVGSSVLLDNDANEQLFTSLSDGTHKPGTVGGMTQEAQEALLAGQQ